MAEKTLEERLSELYEKIDHRDQFFDKDLKTLIEGIRDAREHGGSSDYTELDNKPAINGVQLSGDKTPAQLGLATANQVETLSDKVDKLPTGYYYGKFSSVEDLPEATEKGYAYVASSDPTVFYTYLVSGAGAEWVDSGNKMVNTVDITTPKTSGTELSKDEKYYASANVSDRPADVVIETGVVRSLGYRVLSPNLSFAEQVNSANTIYEIKDSFDLEGWSVTIPDRCTLKFNGGKITNGTILFTNTIIEGKAVMDVNIGAGSNIANDMVDCGWFGMKADDNTFDNGPIITKVSLVFSRILIPKGNFCILTGAIVSNPVVLECYANLKWYGNTTNTYCIRVANSQGSSINFYGSVSSYSSGISYDNFGRNTSMRGIEIFNSNNSIVYINEVKYFNEGVRISNVGGGGCCYNTVTINLVENCNISLRVYQAGSTTSWANENMFNRLRAFHESTWYASNKANVLCVLVAGPIWDNEPKYKGLYSNNTAYSTDDVVTKAVTIAGSTHYYVYKAKGDYEDTQWESSHWECIDSYNHCNGLHFTNICTEWNTVNPSFYFWNVTDSTISDGRNEGSTAGYVYYREWCGRNDVSLPHSQSKIAVYENSSAYPLKIPEMPCIFDGTVYPNGFVKLHGVNGTSHLFVSEVAEFVSNWSTFSNGPTIMDVDTNGNPLWRISPYKKSIAFRIKNGSLLKVLSQTKTRFGIRYITGERMVGGILTTEDLISSPSLIPNYPAPKSRYGFPLNYNDNNYYSYVSGVDSDDLTVSVPDSIKEFYLILGNATEATLSGITIYANKPSELITHPLPISGDSTNRPTNPYQGFKYFDTTLGKPIYWGGSSWVDGNGEAVGLQVSDTTVLIGAAAGSTTINVYHTNALRVSALNPDNTPATWLTVPSTIAVGTNTLTISAAANTASNPRGAKVIISDDTDVVIVNVVQNYSAT